MKLVAGSILAGFGLLVTALDNLHASTNFATITAPNYHFYLGGPVKTLAIIFIVVGICLIGWGIWDAIKKVKI